MKKSKMKECPLWKASTIGIIISFAVTVLLIILVSIFIQNEYIDIISIPAMSYIVMFISILLGASTSGFLVSNKGWQGSIVVGAAYFFLALCIALACFEGIESTFAVGLLTSILSVISAILVCNTRKKRSNQNRKRRLTR